MTSNAEVMMDRLQSLCAIFHSNVSYFTASLQSWLSVMVVSQWIVTGSAVD